MADPLDISRAVAAMEKLQGVTLPYIPPWLRIDRDERPEPEGDTHIIAFISGRYFESDSGGWPR